MDKEMLAAHRLTATDVRDRQKKMTITPSAELSKSPKSLYGLYECFGGPPPLSESMPDPVTEDRDALKMKIIQLMNLLGDIVAQATQEPAKLTAFNSALLSKACIEIWNHNNPDNPVDERTAQIYEQMAKVGYNV